MRPKVLFIILTFLFSALFIFPSLNYENTFLRDLATGLRFDLLSTGNNYDLYLLLPISLILVLLSFYFILKKKKYYWSILLIVNLIYIFIFCFSFILLGRN